MEIPIAENVKQFKLSDGEEIIAEIIEDVDVLIFLTNLAVFSFIKKI